MSCRSSHRASLRVARPRRRGARRSAARSLRELGAASRGVQRVLAELRRAVVGVDDAFLAARRATSPRTTYSRPISSIADQASSRRRARSALDLLVGHSAAEQECSRPSRAARACTRACRASPRAPASPARAGTRAPRRWSLFSSSHSTISGSRLQRRQRVVVGDVLVGYAERSTAPGRRRPRFGPCRRGSGPARRPAERRRSRATAVAMPTWFQSMS